MARDSHDGSSSTRADQSGKTEAPGNGAGLSTDYLNHYVEVLMLIEMAPHEPSLCADLVDWWPISYVEWFSSSQVPHAPKALAAYEGLPGEDRLRFERHLAVMETLATMAAFALQPPCAAGHASLVVEATAPVLRRMITSASTFLDSAGRRLPDAEALNEAERVIDEIIAMRPDAKAAEAQAKTAVVDREARAAAGNTRILIVEDDALLRELYGRALKRAGYQVLTVETGEKALSTLREWGDGIDWLFTDIRLPGQVSGWMVGSEFSLNHPLRPVIYGSGYEPENSRQVANSIFLRKPVNLGELVAAFRGLNAAYNRVMGR
jgi:two-component system, OmpR family, response regulator